MRRPFSLLVLLAVGLIGATAQSPPTVGLEAATERTLYREGAQNLFYVQARIRPGPPAPNAPTATRNVALVLDRSGSMAGERLPALGAAAIAAIEALQPHDLVSVVTFGSTVETLIDAQPADAARARLDVLKTWEIAGGAALYDALNQGAAQLRRHASRATQDQLILVTDGPPTRGPREDEDFTRLAELFAQEGIAVSTVGIGDEFDEDLLSNVARLGEGGFHFATEPADIGTALTAAVAPAALPVARDAVLTFSFKDYCEDVTPLGWRHGTVDGTTLTYRVPVLYAGRDITVMASARNWNTFVATGHVPAAVTITLTWHDLDTLPGTAPRTATQSLPLRFVVEPRDIRDSINRPVFGTVIDLLISEGLQDAIDELDKDSPSRALRALRRTRTRVNNVALQLEDQTIAAKLNELDASLADIERRGSNRLPPAVERKLLRSGINHRFVPPPVPDPDEDK